MSTPGAERTSAHPRSYLDCSEADGLALLADQRRDRGWGMVAEEWRLDVRFWPEADIGAGRGLGVFIGGRVAPDPTRLFFVLGGLTRIERGNFPPV